MKTSKKTYRVEFTVDHRSGPVRKALEGTDLDKLMARVEKLDGYNTNVLMEV